MKLFLGLSLAWNAAVCRGWGGLDTPALLRASEIEKGEKTDHNTDSWKKPNTRSDNASRLFRSPGQTQLVFVDFDTHTESGDHVYSASERTFILSALRDQYDRFSVTFTDTPPPTGVYSTVLVNHGNIGGQANNIDFLNQVHDDNAQVNLNGMGIGVDKMAVATANIILHELGHLVGLRHYDSLGPPGSGLPVSGIPSRNDYTPAYSGPVNAVETNDHVMSSPGSVGSTNGDLETLNFLDERSLLQMEFVAGRGTILTSGQALALSSGQGIVLNEVVFENSLHAGVNAGTNYLVMKAVVVDTANLEAGSTHVYRFGLEAGEFLTVEVVSLSDDNILNQFDSQLHLLGIDGSEIASNDDSFEGRDANLIDVEIQSSGVYTLRVSGFQGASGTYKLWVYTADPTKIATNDGPNVTPSPTPLPTGTSPPPTPAQADSAEPSLCFSSSNTVEVQGKGTVSIEDLNIGDYVRIDSVTRNAGKQYSLVYSFSHRDPTLQASYLQIRVENRSNPLEVSAYHMMTSNGKMVRAKDIRIGDRLNRDTLVVSNVTIVSRRGLYAPVTLNGGLMVSGVRVSSYVALLEIDSSIMQFATHATFAWHRLLCTHDFTFCRNETYRDGISVFVLHLKYLVEWIGTFPSAVQLATVLTVSPLMVGVLCLENLLLSRRCLIATVFLLLGINTLRKRTTTAKA